MIKLPIAYSPNQRANVLIEMVEDIFHIPRWRSAQLDQQQA
ncbi:hypothetical protein AM1_2523 [Acaryochloris marina MBIC11017]|uniref:Uncharacterized protein n=1 Tax=Acaryochloris marina (strain MBIC 11017) TaxID=329726 RepID=B0C5F5_ACAM1|nr:hypothetical protein AM1_2523 [Acaryochloris marina MBIC11017]